ncbi:hypothetical protein ScalyP_jg10081 [Parmales sp. scaly parma]|nr:hypothetical protein ScalyP_jg10081 [Parmales sp. scaly parma]
MSGGFGICGHKNHYTSKVKVENWVEDHFGEDLANNPANLYPMEYKTDTTEKLIDPKFMVDNAGGDKLNLMGRDEIMQNSMGLPSHMLFEHLGAPGTDRYMSINNMTFTAGKGSGGIKVEKLLQEKPSDETRKALDIKPKREKMTQKSKSDARTDNLINGYQTNSQASNKRVTAVTFAVRAPEEMPVMLDFRRRKIAIN